MSQEPNDFQLHGRIPVLKSISISFIKLHDIGAPEGADMLIWGFFTYNEFSCARIGR
jgi:hypothetical protein